MGQGHTVCLEAELIFVCCHWYNSACDDHCVLLPRPPSVKDFASPDVGGVLGQQPSVLSPVEGLPEQQRAASIKGKTLPTLTE